MKEEIWKDIKGLEGKYQESNFGNVRSYRKMAQIKPCATHTYAIWVNGEKVRYKPSIYKEEIKDYDGEIWKEVDGYNGKYHISNFGRIKMMEHYYFDKPFRLLKLHSVRLGYKHITLTKDGVEKRYLFHRLVARHFIANPNNYPHVNHKDENPSNNRADNLEWCTRLYNVRYGTAIERKKEKLKKYKKPVEQYNKDGVFIKRWESATDAAKELGLHSHCICMALKGKNKTYKNYIWRYA